MVFLFYYFMKLYQLHLTCSLVSLHIRDLSALEVFPFHFIALYETTFTYLLTYFVYHKMSIDKWHTVTGIIVR